MFITRKLCPGCGLIHEFVKPCEKAIRTFVEEIEEEPPGYPEKRSPIVIDLVS